MDDVLSAELSDVRGLSTFATLAKATLLAATTHGNAQTEQSVTAALRSEAHRLSVHGLDADDVLHDCIQSPEMVQARTNAERRDQEQIQAAVANAAETTALRERCAQIEAQIEQLSRAHNAVVAALQKEVQNTEAKRATEKNRADLMASEAGVAKAELDGYARQWERLVNAAINPSTTSVYLSARSGEAKTLSEALTRAHEGMTLVARVPTFAADWRLGTLLYLPGTNGPIPVLVNPQDVVRDQASKEVVHDEPFIAGRYRVRWVNKKHPQLEIELDEGYERLRGEPDEGWAALFSVVVKRGSLPLNARDGTLLQGLRFSEGLGSMHKKTHLFCGINGSPMGNQRSKEAMYLRVFVSEEGTRRRLRLQPPPADEVRFLYATPVDF